MALKFNNTSTKCESTTESALAGNLHTIVLWFKANSETELGTASGLGRFFSLGGEQFQAHWNQSAGTIEVSRTWTAGGTWSILAPSHDGTTWIGLGITYDGSLAANAPVFWVRALGTDPAVVSKAVTTVVAASGSIAAIANGVNVGNRADGARPFDGDIAYVAMWTGSLLTQAQIDAELNNPGSVAGAALRWTLLTDGTDSSGNNFNATIASGVFEAGPPGIPAVSDSNPVGVGFSTFAGAGGQARLDALAELARRGVRRTDPAARAKPKVRRPSQAESHAARVAREFAARQTELKAAEDRRIENARKLWGASETTQPTYLRIPKAVTSSRGPKILRLPRSK